MQQFGTELFVIPIFDSNHNAWFVATGALRLAPPPSMCVSTALPCKRSPLCWRWGFYQRSVERKQIFTKTSFKLKLFRIHCSQRTSWESWVLLFRQSCCWWWNMKWCSDQHNIWSRMNHSGKIRFQETLGWCIQFSGPKYNDFHTWIKLI